MLMGLCEAERLSEQPKNVDTVMQKSALHFLKISISEMMILLMNFRSKVS